MFPGTKQASLAQDPGLVPAQLRNSTLWDIGLWLLKQRQRFQVVGVSMLPMLRPGDEILVDRQWYRRSTITTGDVVVVKSPRQPNQYLVKRVISIHPDGSYFIQGDNHRQSTDSWDFGWVDQSLIVGRVTSRFL